MPDLRLPWRVGAAARLGLLVAALLGGMPAPASADPAGLRERHAQLQDQLRRNEYGQALHIDSSEQHDRLAGDVYAVLDHPFRTVAAALRAPEAWCDILILPFNTKYCHAAQHQGSPALLVRIGRKYDQPVERAFRLAFAWQGAVARSDWLELRLQAAEGPVGTRDYRIAVQAIPLEGDRTFLRLNYSYGFGMAGRMAMQAYLGTVGADKVGFSVVGRDRHGQPEYIGGVRGAIERNAMRYYLAIDAYLDALAAPAPERPERRIQGWFAATERYPRQLREMDRSTYVAMKRHEVERQRTLIE